MMVRRLCLLFIALAVSACSSVTPSCPPPAAGDVVYVSEQGWHAEIGIPVEELDKDLRFTAQSLPKPA